MANKKSRKKKRITWTQERDKSEYVHPSLRPTQKGEELLIHKTFKK